MFGFTIDQNIIKEEISLKALYDIVIIGGGPGAYNASIYAARNGLSVLMISKESGGQLINTNVIDNYLGYYNISGEELNNRFLNHLDNFDIDKLMNSEVINLIKRNNLFEVTLLDERIIKGKSVIIATGGNPRKLNVKGEDTFTGKGVSYCVICDGAFYNKKDVLVVGGGNSALEAALDLSNYANKVHMVQLLDNFTGDKLLIDKVKRSDNITYQFNSEVIEIMGDDQVNSIKVKEKDKVSILLVDGIFVEIGIIPNSGLVKELVDLNNFGEVITNNDQETSLEGLYAIGDVTNFKYKQVITAVSQGAVAALNINK